MLRRDFLATLLAPRLLAQDPNPVVNDDSAQHKMAGVNGATSHLAMPKVQAPASAGIQPIYTRSGGPLRYGAYHETRLTPDVVRGGLHLIGQLVMSGDARGMEAQPLFAPKVVRNGKTQDLVLCATMANRIYAFDAATYKIVWMAEAGKPVNGTNKIDAWHTNDHFGIFSTPEIVGGNLYACAWISPNGTAEKAAHWLIEVRLTDGTILRRLQLPGANAAVQRKQRASLCSSVADGKRTIFIPFGTIQESNHGAHGFITAVDIDAWKVQVELNLTQGGSGAGVWMAGQAPTVLVEKDSTGKESTFLVFVTGNGDFNPAKACYAECFTKVHYDGAFSVVDWWTPWRDVDRGTFADGWNDMDLAAGGPIVIPEYGLVLGAGKDSILYSLDWRKFGMTQPGDLWQPAGNYAKLKAAPIWFGFYNGGAPAAPTDPKDLNRLFYNKTHHQHGSPTYWPEQHFLYTWCENGNLRAGRVTPDGKWTFLARSEEMASPYSPVPAGGMPGGMLCVSSNGANDGVIWACVPDKDANKGDDAKGYTTGRIFAFDALHFGEKMQDGDQQVQRLWMSDVAPAGHHIFNKFGTPVVNDGRLWQTTFDGRVLVFGV
jgi:hypothetical protein